MLTIEGPSGSAKGEPRVIRVLMHCYPPVGVDPQHVYLREAQKLRLDLEGAQ